MRTPLFPHGTFIFMYQGPARDCYLLTALDCLLHSGYSGHALLQSMFTEVKEGVFLRIKHTEQSTNLNLDKVRAKYGYYYDANSNEDVFFLDNRRLSIIDNSVDGVKTNSLAVKIFEHISSYYYEFEKTNSQGVHATSSNTHTLTRQNSITAHNLKGRMKPLPRGETLFISNLLNIHTFHIPSIGMVIKIKQIVPHQPIYICMDYLSGKQERHTWLLHGITTNRAPGNCTFRVLNPWNNSRFEFYSLAEIKKRGASFSLFATEPEKQILLFFLLDGPVELGRLIFSDTALLEMILQVKRIGCSLITLSHINYLVELYEQDPRLPHFFNQFASIEQEGVVFSLIEIVEKKDVTLHETFLLYIASLMEMRMPKAAVSNSLLEFGMFREQPTLEEPLINSISYANV